MKTIHRLLPALLTILLLAPLACAEEAKTVEPYEAWFVLKMGGQRAGHMHTTLKQDGENLVSTTSMILAIKRGEVEIRVEQSSKFVETLDHKPVSAESTMKFATMATEQHIDYTGDKWTITSTNAGQKTRVEVDPPKVQWKTPGALAEYLETAIADGEKELQVTTLDPSAGTTPVEITMTRAESADIEVFGKVVPATRWKTTMSATPGVEIEQWTDAAGQPVRQLIPLMPGMEIEMLLADKALALAAFDAPEMLAASFITPNKKIKNPRKLKRAVFDLVSKDLKENVGDAVPSDTLQTTKWVNDDTLRISIDLDNSGLRSKNEIEAAYLDATSMLNYKDKAVAKLTEQVLVKQHVTQEEGVVVHGPMARNLREFVREHIDAKDLSVGFASASETARTKQGDCTEHACLLAAMLRGAGIPSRTVTGLVYADQFAGEKGIFGFHMWAQAWIQTSKGKGYWLDLDAAMPGQVDGFDATHIALATSVMKDGEAFNEMVTLLPLMKGMEIKVIELEWAE
ncbi:MAG: transglutaminase-like domain-containing protein [Phycisphaeraceae bacterium]|nr:transglutaminase-like domain-containing protein [Phycisphaeraceae bacterium]